MSVTTQKVCDNCGKSLNKNNYSTWISNSGTKRIELDFCNECSGGSIKLNKAIQTFNSKNQKRRPRTRTEPTNLEEFINMWNDDMPVEEIAEKTGIKKQDGCDG